MQTKLDTKQLKVIDDKLSKRPIALDPGGYYIIYLDREARLICAKHYTNIINEKGLAVNPETGEVIAARGKKVEPYTLVEPPKNYVSKLLKRLNPAPLPCWITLPIWDGNLLGLSML